MDLPVDGPVFMKENGRELPQRHWQTRAYVVDGTLVSKLESSTFLDGLLLDMELDGKKVTITANANEKGNLFGSINEAQIIEAIKSGLGVDVSSEYINTKEVIKNTGIHVVEIKIDDTTASVSIEVLPEK